MVLLKYNMETGEMHIEMEGDAKQVSFELTKLTGDAFERFESECGLMTKEQLFFCAIGTAWDKQFDDIE